MMTEEILLKTDELAGGTGTTYRQIDYWVRNEILRGVERYRAQGSGSVRYFTFEDFRVASVLTSLTRLGLAGEGLRTVSHELYRLLPEMPATGWVVVDALGVRASVGRRSPADVLVRLTTSPLISLNGPCYVVPVPARMDES